MLNSGPMRTYRQFCGLAKALDAVGDRWSLLIVRELMLQGSCRYTDLMRGLPGIAPNLLAERLRQLEAAGVIRREFAPPPVATNLFSLSSRGRDLLPVIRELGRWGGPLLMEADEADAFHTYWMALPIELYYYDPSPDAGPVAIELRTGDEAMVLETAGGKVKARRGRAENPDALLSGPPKLVIGVLSGRLGLEEARRQGLKVEGDPGVLERVKARAAPP